MRNPLLTLLFGFGLLGGAYAEDGATPDTLATLQQRADAAALWSLPGWQKMLHMEAGAVGGGRSAVHSAWFFLAENGRSDARAELHATLRAFVENQTVPARDEKAACVFGLRWRFLDAHLDLQAAGVLTPDCPRRAQWWQALNPERAWLVFPAAYLNSPASMFGHTLLRIDGTRGSETSPLLAYAVNFAAQTEAENSLVYAYKGLTGGYVGRFSVMPYYEKVREYGRIEVRDLWEYPLQLPEPALERVILHLWELRGAGFDYYFFTRNCSYQLLTLLEVAMPERNLRQGLRWRAIPTDTIGALDHQGLLGAPRYRPSMGTTLRHRADLIGPDDTRIALSVARGERDAEALPDWPAQRQARALDVAHDWLYHHTQNGPMDRDTGVARARGILAARAGTGVRSDFPPPAAPATAPHAGHPTARLFSGMFSGEGGAGLALGLRAAYHDVLDPVGGYDQGSEVAFGEVDARWDTRGDRLQLHRLTLVQILSMSPRGPLFQPVSWRVQFGGRRLSGVNSRFGGYLDGGPGLAWRFGQLTTYGFARMALDAAQDLEQGYSLGGGARLGAAWETNGPASLLVEARSRNALLGGDFERHQLDLGAQWHWDRTVGLRLHAYVARQNGEVRRGLRLGITRYFDPGYAASPEG